MAVLHNPGVARAVVATPIQNSLDIACIRRLERIGGALRAYQRDHHKLPSELSQLYPRYLSHRRLLHCPAESPAGKGGPTIYQESSGSKPGYEYTPAEDPLRISTRRLPASLVLQRIRPEDYWDWRKRRAGYGDRIPVVRCYRHGLILNLTLSGHVYSSEWNWETEPETVAVVLRQMERDLTGKPGQFTRKWNLVEISHYFNDVCIDNISTADTPGGRPPQLFRYLIRPSALAVATELSRLARISPPLKRRDVLYALAKLYEMLEEYAPAIETYSQALKLLKPLDKTAPESQTMSIISSMSWIYQHQRRYDRAIIGYEVLAQTGTHYVGSRFDGSSTFYKTSALIALESLYMKTGQYKKAITAFEQQMSTLPADEVVSPSWLVEAYEKTGQKEKAEAVRRQMGSGGPKIGSMAPDFAVRDVSGRVIQLSHLYGKVMLLSLWGISARNRGAQVQYLHTLNRVSKQYHNRGLVVICVDRSIEGQEDLDFTRSTVVYPLVIAGDQVFKKYCPCPPSLFLIDRQGKLRERFDDYGPVLSGSLETVLRKILR